MRAKIANLLVVFTLICAIGGHWAILQSVAWVGMAVDYSQDATLAEALAKTFDGKHPCKICKVVEAGKKSEQKQSSLKVETKFDFWMTNAASLLDPPNPFVVLPARPSAVEVHSESPPTPPPRLA